MKDLHLASLPNSCETLHDGIVSILVPGSLLVLHLLSGGVTVIHHRQITDKSTGRLTCGRVAQADNILTKKAIHTDLDNWKLLTALLSFLSTGAVCSPRRRAHSVKMLNHSSTASSSAQNSTGASRDTLVIVQLVCYTVIMAVGSLGNILLIISLARQHHHRSSRYLIINLSVTDLLTCVVSSCFDISILVVGHWPFGAAMCKVVYPLQTALIAVSVSTLLCMTFERYRAILHPFKRKPRGKSILLVCCGIWLVSALLVIPYSVVLKYDGNNCSEDWPGPSYPKAFTMCIFLILYVIPLSIMTVMYARVGIRLRQESKALRAIFGDSANSSNLSAIRSKRRIRLVKIFVCAVVAFALCLSPFQIMWLWADYGSGQQWVHFDEVLTFANVMVYTNAVVNPFIFGSLARRYRFNISKVTLKYSVKWRRKRHRSIGELLQEEKLCNSPSVVQHVTGV